MFNPLTNWVSQIHQTEMVNFALNQKSVGKPLHYQGVSTRVLLWLGDRLIGAGERLHERYSPVTCSDCGPVPTSL